MKLYFYYLNKDGNIKKFSVSNIRKNKYDYTVPAGCEYPFNSLSAWHLKKQSCNIVQVDNTMYSHSPFIISEQNNLDQIPQCAEMLQAVFKNCIIFNEKVKEWIENEG